MVKEIHGVPFLLATCFSKENALGIGDVAWGLWVSTCHLLCKRGVTGITSENTDLQVDYGFSCPLLWHLVAGISSSLYWKHSFPGVCCRLLGSLGVCLRASPLPLKWIFLRSRLRHPHPSYSVFFFLLQTNPQLSFGMQSYNSHQRSKIHLHFFFFFFWSGLCLACFLYFRRGAMYCFCYIWLIDGFGLNWE